MADMPMPEQEAPAQESGGATGLVTQIHSNMMDLSDMFDKSPAIPPEDKQELAGLIQGFQALVDKLGQAPGQSQPSKAPAKPGYADFNAGAADAKPMM